MYTEKQLQDLGINLRRFRIDNGFTFKQMSLILKVSKPSLSAIEKHRSVSTYLIDEVVTGMKEKFGISLCDTADKN